MGLNLQEDVNRANNVITTPRSRTTSARSDGLVYRGYNGFTMRERVLDSGARGPRSSGALDALPHQHRP